MMVSSLSMVQRLQCLGLLCMFSSSFLLLIFLIMSLQHMAAFWLASRKVHRYRYHESAPRTRLGHLQDSNFGLYSANWGALRADGNRRRIMVDHYFGRIKPVPFWKCKWDWHLVGRYSKTSIYERVRAGEVYKGDHEQWADDEGCSRAYDIDMYGVCWRWCMSCGNSIDTEQIWPSHLHIELDTFLAIISEFARNVRPWKDPTAWYSATCFLSSGG